MAPRAERSSRRADDRGNELGATAHQGGCQSPVGQIRCAVSLSTCDRHGNRGAAVRFGQGVATGLFALL